MTNIASKLIAELRKANPYPASIFIEPSKAEWKEIAVAVNRIRSARKLASDGVFGSWGREVWENCVKKLEELSKEEDEQN